MNKKDLVTYLNDHHAGATGALEMLNALAKSFQGQPLELFFKNLQTEIQADFEALESLMKKIGSEGSAIKQAGAWVAEKISRAKLGASDPAADQLELFQALETLMLGITGKCALWAALAAAAEGEPALRLLDYAKLQERAVQQRDRVEAERLRVARELFSQG